MAEGKRIHLGSPLIYQLEPSIPSSPFRAKRLILPLRYLSSSPSSSFGYSAKCKQPAAASAPLEEALMISIPICLIPGTTAGELDFVRETLQLEHESKCFIPHGRYNCPGKG